MSEHPPSISNLHSFLPTIEHSQPPLTLQPTSVARMHTKTSKHILAPLAETVTQLILIISESEINKTPMPDFSALAKVVHEQIQNLVEVGHKISGQSDVDDIVTREMPNACTQVMDASGLLLVSTSELKTDARSSSAKTKLLDATKGILKGTTGILNAFDDFEVRKIIRNIQHLSNETEIIKAYPQTITNAQKLVHTIAKVAQMIVHVAQAVTARATEVVSLVSSTRLNLAVTGLSKESPLLINSVKIMLQHPSDQNCQLMKNLSCDRIISVCQDMIDALQLQEDTLAPRTIAVQTKNESHQEHAPLNEALQKLNENKTTLISDVFSHVPQDNLKADLEEYKKHATTVHDTAKQEIQHVLDMLSNKHMLNEAHIDHLSELLQRQIQSGEHPLQQKLAEFKHHIQSIDNNSACLFSDTSSRQQKEMVFQELHQAAVCSFDIEKTMDQHLLAGLMECCQQLSDSNQPMTYFGKTIHACNEGAVEETVKRQKTFVAKHQQMEQLLDPIIHKLESRNKPLATILGGIKDRLHQIVPSLTVAFDIRSRLPQDEGVHELLTSLTTIWEDQMKDLQKMVFAEHGVFDATDILAASDIEFKNQVHMLQEALETKNADDALEAVNGIKYITEFAMDFGKRELEYSTHVEYKSVLQGHTEQMDSSVPEVLIKIMNRLKAQQFDGASFENLIGPIANTMHGLHDIINKEHGQVSQVTPVAPELPPELTDASPTMTTPGSGPETPMLDLDTNRTDEKLLVPDKESNTFIQQLSDLQISESSESIVILSEERIMLKGEVLHLKDIEIICEEAPKLLGSEEALASPIKAAAFEIRKEASRWTATNNPIVETAKMIARLMAGLSDHHYELKMTGGAGSKRGFIQCAQDILVQTNAFMAPTKNLADKCTDKRLRKQLMSTLEQMSTIAQQLKIVAAVKASAPFDCDRDHLLVECARNLMVTIKRCLKECESASLRQLKQELTGIKTPEAVRFKRAVYRGTSVPRIV